MEIYNTAEAAYHISPEIYYNLLAVKSCSLSGVRTNFIMELRLLKGSISVYKKRRRFLYETSPIAAIVYYNYIYPKLTRGYTPPAV